MVKDRLEDRFCPFGAIAGGILNRTYCAVCTGKPCTKNAGSNITLSCKETETDDIIDEILRSSPMFFDGGGVTFTGGEPTVQFEPLRELLTRLKKLGIHTALETNGSHLRLPELFRLIDWLIIDCKHYDSAIHEKVTGIDNRTILLNIEAAAKNRSQLLVRIPLISGFNASSSDAEHFAETLSRITSDICSFELLRYQEYGKGKWAQCGLPYTMTNADISDEVFNNFADVFKAHHLKLVST